MLNDKNFSFSNMLKRLFQASDSNKTNILQISCKVGIDNLEGSIFLTLALNFDRDLIYFKSNGNVSQSFRS